MKKNLLAMTLLLCIANANGEAMLMFVPTPSEMQLLPDFCRARFAGQKSPEFQAWAERLGRNYFNSLHHYCAGINYTKRYLNRVNDKKRDYYLSRAVPEIDYVAKGMPPDHPLADVIYFNRGMANQLMQKDAAAIADYTKAIDRNPTHENAYLSLADINSKLGNKAKALDIVVAGLRNIPDSKGLQKKYLSLGGKEPFPAPLVTKAPKTESPQPIEPSAAPEATIANDSAPDVATGSETATTKSTASPIGTTQNPYCRFCPPEE